MQARAPKLLTKLTETPPATAHKVLDELAFVAEQATREGRTGDVAALFSALLDREAVITDPDVRRIFLMTVRRLTKPTILRPIAGAAPHASRHGGPHGAHPAACGPGRRRRGGGPVPRIALGAGAPALSRSPLAPPPAGDSLLQMLTDPRWYIVRQAAEFLGEMGLEQAERPLAELLRHQDERVRRAATRALSRIESSFTLDAMGRAVTDASPSVRLEAVAGLSSRKSGRAGSILGRAIDGEAEQEVQFAILGGLGRVATPEAVQKLAKAAEAASGLFASRKNIGLRIAAVNALGEARTAGALTALQSLANDKDKDVKEAVAKTLLLLRGSAA